MPPKRLMLDYSEKLSAQKFDLTRSIDDVVHDIVKFEALLHKWQQVQNLVSRETFSAFWHRHVLDSLQLLPLIKSEDQCILDIGSGGGLPIIPLAIALKGQGRRFNLVESNRRKVSFLRTVSRELSLGFNVHGCRVENINSQEIGSIDLITSRATASLSNLLTLVQPFWGDGTKALLHKGAEFSVELEEAGANWAFDVICMPSITSEFGQILDIRHLKNRID